MAQKKPGRPPKKKTVAKTKQNTQKQQLSFYRRHHDIIVQILSVLAVFVGLFGLISMFFDVTGQLGKYFKTLALGLFGTVGYFFPVAIIYIGFNTGMKAKKRGYHRGNLSSIGLLVFVAGLIHLFIVDQYPTKNLVALWKLGNNELVFWNGGATGGFLTSVLVEPVGKIGIVIIYAALLVILSILMSDATVEKIVTAVAGWFKRERKVYVEDEHTDTAKDLEDYEKAFAPVARPHKHSEIDFNIEPEKSPLNSDLDVIFSRERLKSAEPLESDVFEQTHTVQQQQIDFKSKPATLAASPEQNNNEKISSQEVQKQTQQVEHEISSIQQEQEQKPSYVFPPMNLLTADRQGSTNGTAELKLTAEKIVETLSSFGVATQLVDVSQGPTVTRYELAPQAGVKISKITNLSDDIALSLAASGVRIEAPIPGKAAVGIEVPNKNIRTVYLRSIIENDSFKNAKSKLTFSLGCDLGGQKIVADISKMPHMLIAGSTGSGKSVCINSLIVSLLYKATPDEVRLILIDPKVVELGVYNGIPHLLLPVVTDPKKASGTLAWAVGEMNKRYKLFADNNVKNIAGYNQLAQQTPEMKPIPQIVIIIDELAELMMVSPHEVEDSINRIAALARAAGMHLVVATQRPSVDVITGVIKANIPTRIAFSVASQVDSRTILNMGGAEKLIGRGDMLFAPIGESKPTRIQGCFVSEKEIDAIVDFVKKQAEVEYDNNAIEEIDKQVAESGKKKGSDDSSDQQDDYDPILEQAIEVVVEAGSASTSLLQRKLKLGYARAARVVDQLEEKGVVGPYQGSKPREVRITKQQLYELKMRNDTAAEMQVNSQQQQNEI